MLMFEVNLIYVENLNFCLENFLCIIEEIDIKGLIVYCFDFYFM